MDAAKLALLKADINAQRATIDRIFRMLEICEHFATFSAMLTA
jgi:hypothetical protein